MNPLIDLAGQELPWRLLDGKPVSDWLRQRPWRREGGVRALRVSSAAFDLVSVSLVREIHAAEQGRDRIAVMTLEACDVAAGPLTAFARALSLEPTSERVLAGSVGEQVALEAMVLIAPAFGLADLGSLHDAFTRFVEMVGKLGFDRQPVVLLVHDEADAVGATFWQLDRGFPLGATELILDRTVAESAAWLVYLHLRFAWEAEGDLAAAQRLDSSLMQRLRVGDEEGLEEVLNAHARHAGRQMTPVQWSAWQEYFEQVLADRAEARPRRRIGRPDGIPTEGGLAPAWLVRAFALRTPPRALVPFLRSAMICRPLSLAILSRAFELEGLIRCRLATPDPTLAPESARSGLWKYQTFGDNLIPQLYPASHPLRPDCPWDFASLGDFTAVLKSQERPVDAYVDQLRILRNAMAHNHPAAWAAVMKLRELEGSMAARA